MLRKGCGVGRGLKVGPLMVDFRPLESCISNTNCSNLLNKPAVQESSHELRSLVC